MSMPRVSHILSRWSSSARRLGFVRWGAVVTFAAIFFAALIALVANQTATAQKQRDAATDLSHNGAVRAPVESLVTDTLIAQQGGETDGANDGGCPEETVTYSTHNFMTGAFTAQQGFVETEIAAVTFTLNPASFPLRIDRVDGLFGTQTLSSQTTTHWTMMIWEGQPNNGNLLCTVAGCTIQSDDDGNPPHITVGPPNNGVTLQVVVDPSDPKQIIVSNNGSNQFSVGFQINEHNNPPTVSCQCIPGCGICGTLPAVCCPPNPNTNVFPTTDATVQGQAPNFPAQNWLWARACMGSTCALQSGWYTFQQLGQMGGSPSGDWNIRAVFTPTGCTTPVGACCLNNGQCLGGLTSAECSAQGGTYQGNSTDCGTTNCPVPTGTCCLANGSCIIATTANCASQGGTFVSVGGVCNTNTCRGACCVPATQQCVFTTEANCAAANGVFQGIGTNCTGTCFGACCLPSGSCVQAISSSSCTSQGGTWQGGGVSCANANCPQPLGACCLGSSCLSDLSESDCVTGFGGQWLGGATTCEFNPCDPLGACCLGTSCLSDLTESDCTTGFGGVWQGAQSGCAKNPCTADTCPADIAPAPNGDDTVNVADLLLVINSWGACPAPPTSCVADIAPQPNGDNTVNVADLLFVIGNWGSCR